MTNICKNCRFFAPGVNECRRYPPSAAFVPANTWVGTDYGLIVDHWTEVEEDDWCGEFKELEDEDE